MDVRPRPGRVGPSRLHGGGRRCFRWLHGRAWHLGFWFRCCCCCRWLRQRGWQASPPHLPAASVRDKEALAAMVLRRSAERFRAIREQSLPSSYSLKPRSERPGASQEQAMVSDLREALGVHTFGPKGRRRDERTGHTERHYELFLDLIERMLEWDPRKRVRPMQALNHPFLREDVEAGREDAAASRTGTPSGSSGPGGAAAAPAAAAADPSDATPAAGHVRSTAAAAAVSAAAAMAASASSGAAAASAAPAGPRSSAAAHLRSGETDSRGYTIL